MSSLSEFSIRLSAFGRAMRRQIKTFLPQEQGRYQRIAVATVETSVYQAYTPIVYERTGNLKRSMRAHFPDEGNTQVMFIDSDPSVAPAILAGSSEGYGPYVAGEGPGIGFLALSAPQVFPREFHEQIFNNLSAEVPHRLMEKFDRIIAKL